MTHPLSVKHYRMDMAPMWRLILAVLGLGGMGLTKSWDFRKDKVLNRAELGCVFLRGRLISIAESQHVIQDFVLRIPPVLESRHLVSIVEQCLLAAQNRRENNWTTTEGYSGICNAIMLQEEWLDRVTNDLIEARQQAVDEIMQTVPEGRDDRRSTRAAGVPILNVFAQLGHYVFGIARSDDVAINAEKIEVVTEGVNRLSIATETLITVMDDKFRKMERNMKDARTHQEALIRGFHSLTDSQTRTQRRVTRNSMAINEGSLFMIHLSMLTRVKMGYVIHLLNDITTLRDMVAEVRLTLRHRLSSKLVSPSALRRAIENTGNYLKETYPRYKVAFQDPEFYYENSRVECTRIGNVITIHLNIPVVSGEHLFDVFEVVTLTVPVRVAGRPTDGTKLRGLPKDVAISRSGQYYIAGPVLNWARCIGERIALCPDVPHMRKVSEQVCMAALIRNDRSGIAKHCEVDYIVKPVFADLSIYLGAGTLLVSSQSTEGTVLCKSHPPVRVVVHHYSMIHLPCDCGFTTAGSWIPYSLRGCKDEHQSNNISYPSNDLLKLNLDREKWAQTILNGKPIEILEHDPLPALLRDKHRRTEIRDQFIFHYENETIKRKDQTRTV